MSKGTRIKGLREAAGMTQQDLAKKLKTTKQTISKYEKNIVTNIPSDRIEALAVALSSTPEYIMGWAPKIKKNEQIAEILCSLKTLDANQLQIVEKCIKNIKK